MGISAFRRTDPVMVKAAWWDCLGYRPAWLERCLRIPLLASALCWLTRIVLAAYLLFLMALLLLRYVLLPEVAHYRGEIEQAVSGALGVPVRIERIAPDWQGLNPRLILEGVRLLDRQGLPALAFERVEGVLSWHSLFAWRPHLALLAIDRPVLHIRRDSAGQITVAGMSTEGEGDRRAGDWLFEQGRIRIRDATIVWEDAWRQAPPLVLEDVQFSLDNRGRRHLFGLSALPPARLASRLQIRGEWRGNPMDGLEKLSGHLFSELDYADLSGWRAWVDYPLPLQQGRGALRFWGDWKKGEAGVIADLALEDVRVRLGSQVPELELSSMRGRLDGRYREADWVFSGEQVELFTLSGIRVPPTDFRLAWRQNGGDTEARRLLAGKATANFVDLGALQHLSAYLPLDAQSRELLAAHRPQGRITDLRLAWEIEGSRLKYYDLDARFDGLGVQATGNFPGGSGFSGRLTANDRGGNLLLQGQEGASLDLPSVFPEAHLPFSQLQVKANWKIEGPRFDLRLDELSFSSPDAAGSAQGSYRWTGEGPGVIDLKGRLTRAEGSAVWRYMPHAVHVDARQWLKRGITAGVASDVELRLKGDLRHFPFADRREGEFLITAKARGATIDYAPGWPAITGVEADLSFGAGMEIKARSGFIQGARLNAVTVALPDFSAAEEHLHVQGEVEGPSAAFFRFIEKSPVSRMLQHRTEGMLASGNGKLLLKLDLPLRQLDKTRVEGDFSFANNQITLAPGLPPVRQVNGRVRFSENSIDAPAITGQVLGAPLQVAIRDDGDAVAVTAAGGVLMSELGKLVGHPVFDHLSGQTSWKGGVKMLKDQASFVLESNLVGVASSLPEPLNKRAQTPLPLRLEKSALTNGGPGDRLRLVLRDVAEGELLRRLQQGELVVEQGALAVGMPLPPFPARGVAVVVRAPGLIDGDAWQRVLASRQRVDGAPSPDAWKFPLVRLSLNGAQLRVSNRLFHQVEIEARKQSEAWQIALAMQEGNGELLWNPAGEGALRADFKRLAVPAESKPLAPGQVEEAPSEHLPALDLRVADFSYAGKRLGEMKTKARNQGGTWFLDTLQFASPDGLFKGKGEWTTAGRDRTRLEFELTAKDVGKLLDRLKVPVAVRRGTATLKGNLGWNGPMTAVDYHSLDGDLSLLAENGQFSKLEPGVGKLLGLISLQSLPRRLTLDFRDVFSEGLAFDTIGGQLHVKNGVMRTQEGLKIDGPAAHILIQGEADLKAETQGLTVTVQPEMGGVAAVGGAVALANPLVGAGVWVANKVLQNPLNRVFGYQYRVTGSWSDPKVENMRSPHSSAFETPNSPVTPAVEAK